MTSLSPEPLRLGGVPTDVRVAAVPFEAALEAVWERRAAARAQAAADDARASTEAELLGRLSAAVDAAVAAVEAEREAVETSLTEAAVSIGLEIARHVVRTELDEGRHELESVVRECLAKGTRGRGACQVYTCAEDHARLQDMRLRAATELLVDPSLAPGEIRVESPQGLVVRDPESVIERVAEALRESVGR